MQKIRPATSQSQVESVCFHHASTHAAKKIRTAKIEGLWRGFNPAAAARHQGFVPGPNEREPKIWSLFLGVFFLLYVEILV